MRSVILLCSLLAGCSLFGQSLVITDSASTRSICFNDGTIQVAATGGSGIYNFYIIGGPSYPNITYPMSLPRQDSVFLTLPRGQYTIMVVDGSRDTAYATSTVAGTYTFPVISPMPPATVDSTCIIVTAVGGRPPYRFAISSQGTNIGFGPYQSSNAFCGLCDGPYWIRVMDSCSNIFTTNRINVVVPVAQYTVSAIAGSTLDSIIVIPTSGGAPPFTYHLKSGSLSLTNHTGIFTFPRRCQGDTITVTDSCGRVYNTTVALHPLVVNVTSPCNSGIAFVNIDSAAIAPFTITGSNGTLVTHQYQITFTSLPTTGQLRFTVTDSCGNIQVLAVNCVIDTVPFFTVCPFDSSVHMQPNLLRLCYPAVVTCLNCTPVQSDTLRSIIPVELFHGIIDTGFLYRFRIQDSCGRNDTINYVPRFVSFNLGDSLISCRDFTVFPNPHVIYTPPVLYTVYDQGIFVDSSSADQPTFYHLPPGIYQVTASQALCHPNTVTVSLPGLRGACLVPMMDSTCTPSYAVYQSIVTTREHFSLVSTTNSSVYWQKEPSPYSNAAVFVSVPVGSYNLVSDSGCTVPFPLPAFAHTVSAISTRQCTGQALITATVTPPIRSCNSAQGGYITLLKDNQYIASQNIGTGSTAQFMVSDTGYYVVRLFLSNTTDFTLDATFDTICPLDTVLVYVDNNALPNIIAKQVILVCGNVTTNIPYTIFGGTAPYTVQILGYPTRYVPTTHDTFPNVAVGVYTMIVSDSCGISRSFSVSVIDTCSTVCTVNSQFSLNTALVCTSGVVNLQNLSSGASHYRWDINGSIYAYGSDTSFVAFPGNSYTIRLYAYVGICVDSFIVTFIDTCHPVCAVHSRFSVNDSLTCTNQTVTLHNLSTGATSYRWDINGTLYSHATDTSITAAPDSSYTIRLYADSGICVDSFIVTFIDTCHPACTVHSQFAISDTLTCVNVLVSTQNQSTGATSYQWDINGTIYSTATDTSFASSVSGADTIKLYAYKGACIDSSTKTITIIDAVSGAARQDISLCAPFSLQLNSHIANTLWSNTIADSVITVTTPGLYQATVSNGCSSAIDTFNVAEYPGITGFSLTDSKVTICSDRPDTVTVAASIDSGQRSVVFIWSTGQRDSAVYRSDVTSYLSGTYDVTADNGYCPQTRTISIAEAPCDSSCINNFAIPDIFSPNGDRMNDTFFLPHVCNLSPFAMHIYNQWGELVFESQDINQGWDGKYKGKEQPEGVYWLWLMITPGKATIYLSRTVTLVR